VGESALSAFLDERIAQGFRVESRTDTQAIIVSPRRFSILPARFRRSRDGRQVVSVDADGVVTARRAEPLRW